MDSMDLQPDALLGTSLKLLDSFIIINSFIYIHWSLTLSLTLSHLKSLDSL